MIVKFERTKDAETYETNGAIRLMTTDTLNTPRRMTCTVQTDNQGPVLNFLKCPGRDTYVL